MPTRLLLSLGVALIALLLWRSCYILGDGEVALRTRFGQIEGTQYRAGLHLKSPLDDIHIVDRRILTRAYPGESFLTHDQKSLSVDFYLKWQLQDAARFFQATGGDEDMVGLRLADVIRDLVAAGLQRRDDIKLGAPFGDFLLGLPVQGIGRHQARVQNDEHALLLHNGKCGVSPWAYSLASRISTQRTCRPASRRLPCTCSFKASHRSMIIRSSW